MDSSDSNIHLHYTTVPNKEATESMCVYTHSVNVFEYYLIMLLGCRKSSLHI